MQHLDSKTKQANLWLGYMYVVCVCVCVWISKC